MIVTIDYGVGNLGSIRNILKRIGKEVKVTSDPAVIESADRLILPGVGAFDNGMRNLEELGLIDVLNKKVLKERAPILGICLGMQLMSKSSEEGVKLGLGWLDAETIRFRNGICPHLRIPNMGWNSVTIVRQHPLVKDVDANSRFYFVHSYHVQCNNPNDVVATTNYCVDFVSIFSKDNIYGTQFHPEKSLRYGVQILRNFANMERSYDKN